MRIDVKKNQSLLELLSETFPESTKTHLKKIIKYGFVSRGEKILKNPETPLKTGEILNYKKYNGKEIQKENIPFQIVFEDEYLIAVLKPAGILTVGTTTETRKSMYKMVLDYVAEKSQKREKIFVVHRLDREVSGILLFAKSEKIKKDLIENWTENEKLYWALVEGKPQPESDSIESYLMEGAKQKMEVVNSGGEVAGYGVRGGTRYSAKDSDKRHPVPRTSHPAPRTPQLAILHYKTLKHFNDYTLLEVRLETGRKNQIRVQLSGIGCPIVGDRKYGADATYIRQIRLFAYSLSFTHPITKKRTNISLSLPKMFLTIGNTNEKY